MILLLLACAGPSKNADSGTPDTRAETGESADTAEQAPAWVEEDPVCDSPDLDVEADGDGWRVVTAHYDLEISGFDEDEARTLGTLAELSWSGLAAFFGTEVDGPLTVVIAADEAGFQAALAADGISGLEGAGGYYDPGGGKAYLFRQPTTYYSRVLMIHEIVHQYQYHSGVADGLPGWYIEGLAEALGRHHWDGDCLTLRVRPLLSWEDMAAQAWTELDAGAPDLVSVFGGGSASRPLSQELVRLFTSDPDRAARFADWRWSVASGVTSATDLDALQAALGSTDEIASDLADFVPQDQEPLSPIWLDWIPQGEDQALGWSDASSAARIKGETTTEDLRFDWPASGYAGTVYGYDESSGDVELALLGADGTISRFAYIGGVVTWDVYTSVGASDEAVWSQTAGDGVTELTVAGTAVELPRSLAPAGGLALYGGEATFRALSWE